MKKSKVAPTSKLDKNGLNETSIKFASYFYRIYIRVICVVNNYDVDVISDKFLKILQYFLTYIINSSHHSQKLSGTQILEYFHVNYLPLYDLIFKVFCIMNNLFINSLNFSHLE